MKSGWTIILSSDIPSCNYSPLFNEMTCSLTVFYEMVADEVVSHPHSV